MKAMKLTGLFLVMTLLMAAQAPRKFYTMFGGNGYDVGYDVKQTLDGGYIVTGSTSSFGQGNTDMYLFKMDSMGQKKIETAFGGYSNETGKSVVQLADSGFIIAGYTSSTGFGGYDVYLVKADKIGNLVWQKTIGGTDWDFANSIQHTLDGGFIIAGTTYSYGRGNADGYIVKTDANGNITWSKTYGGKKDDEFKSVIQTSDGNYALTGYTKSYNDTVNGDAWVFKVNTSGDSIWCQFKGGTKEDFGNRVIQLQSSSIFISGGTKSNSVNGNTETLIAEYDGVSGFAAYNYIDASTQEEYYNGVAQGINGAIANCGITKNVTFGYDAIVDIYKADFGYLNFFSKGSTLVEEFFSISPTKDKGFVTVGKTNGFGAILDDVFFMKMDSTGNYGTSQVGIYENEFDKIQLQIYPNPANAVFNIHISDVEKYKSLNYIITDIKGNSVLSNKCTDTKTVIDASALAEGFYFVQVFERNQLLSTTKLSIIK
jgi:hypothetical protein